jgi:hypothetical protein
VDEVWPFKPDKTDRYRTEGLSSSDFMSTKQKDTCVHCKSDVLPTDAVVRMESQYGTFPVILWRYICECGNIWANEAQRRHNETEYRRRKRDFAIECRTNGMF